ncbi:MAG: PEGA domain-containing protein [Deltaproteobacteria bacterium]|nr:PEGA domain-containing protein [Deltaproteobacteria bacterium]
MLARMKRLNEAMVFLVLCAFLMSMAAFPTPLCARTVRTDKVDTGHVVLFVPVQRSEYVPEGVPSRVEEYFRALAEIDPKIKLKVLQTPAARPALEEKPAEPAPEPVKTNPRLEKARKLAESGKAAVKKKRLETGLGRLMRAEKLYRRNLKDLEDFDLYVDTYLWLAVGFTAGGYYEEGRAALKRLLTMRPDISLQDKAFNPKFIRKLERRRKRIAKGGDLTVTVDVEGASVYVDGRLVGTGSQTVTGLPRGRHFVRVVAEGLPPAGRFVNTRSPGRTASLRLNLNVARKSAKPARPVVAKVKTRPLTEYAKSGDFTGNFARDARIAMKKAGAEYIVLSYLARSDGAFHLGLFLFDGKSGRLAGIEPAVIDTDLSNLQIALLDLESRLADSLSTFPADRRVTKRPAIYALVPTQRPEKKPVAATPPAPAPAPAPASSPTQKPAAAPVAAVQPTAQATGGFDEIPEDFPMNEWPSESPSRPIYKEWWLWTVVGVVVTGTVVGAVCGAGKCGGGGGGEQTFGARATW